MKLHQHIDLIVTTELSEGQGPVPLKLTLDEIIKDGKVTNPYQIFVLGWLSEFFKKGLKSAALQLENPIDFESNATHTDVVTALKALSPANHVQLAQYLKDCIDAGESALKDPKSTTIEWMKFVLRKQD